MSTLGILSSLWRITRQQTKWGSLRRTGKKAMSAYPDHRED